MDYNLLIELARKNSIVFGFNNEFYTLRGKRYNVYRGSVRVEAKRKAICIYKVYYDQAKKAYDKNEYCRKLYPDRDKDNYQKYIEYCEGITFILPDNISQNKEEE
jgi:hypothetical protein